jgi:hypothetical protein
MPLTVRRVAGTALAAAALALAPAAARAQTPSPNDFVANGGVVTVRFVGATSIVDFSTLAYRIGAFSAGATDYTNLFTNNPQGGTPVGTQVVIGNVAAGTPIIFRLTNTTQNLSFFSGPGTRNQDGAIHLGLVAGSGTAANGGGTFTQGFTFEDRSGTTPPIADFDYNDLSFEIANAAPQNVIPEPSTYALLGAGLAGVVGMARRRRTQA